MSSYAQSIFIYGSQSLVVNYEFSKVFYNSIEYRPTQFRILKLS